MTRIFIICLFFWLLTGVAQAIELTSNGFEVTVNYEQKKGMLFTWGTITGKKNCKQINLTLFMRNENDAELSRVIVNLQDYDAKSDMRWEGKDPVNQDKKHGGEWFVDKLDVKCMN